TLASSGATSSLSEKADDGRRRSLMADIPSLVRTRSGSTGLISAARWRHPVSLPTSLCPRCEQRFLVLPHETGSARTIDAADAFVGDDSIDHRLKGRLDPTGGAIRRIGSGRERRPLHRKPQR